MGKHVFYLLLILISSTFFLPLQNVFSQTRQAENSVVDNNASGLTDKPYKKGITTGRAKSLLGGVIGLASLIIGWRAKRLAKNNSDRARSSAMVALVLGSTGIILSLIHLAATSGAVFGSGSGKAGAIVGIVLSAIGLVLGWLGLSKN